MPQFHSMKKIYLFIYFLFIACLGFFSSLLHAQTVQVHRVDFESNADNWTLAGTNTFRSGGAAYKNGNKLQMAVNNSTATSPTIDISSFDKVDIEMFIRSNDASTNYSVSIEYRPSGSSSWQTLRTVIKGDGSNFRDINFNGTYHYVTATILASAITMGNNAQFRLRTSNNSNFREFYIDYITIYGTNYSTPVIAPGGISSGLDVWLRADQIDGVGLQTDNTNVDLWIDRGRGNNAKVSDATNPLVDRPLFFNNPAQNVNFNPVVNFDNNTATAPKENTYLRAGREFLYGTSGFNTQDFFAVVVPNVTVSNGTNPPMDIFTSQRASSNAYDEDITGFGFGNFSARFSGEVIAYALGTNPSPSPSNPNSRGYGIAEVSGNTYNRVMIVNPRNNTSGTQELFVNALDIGNTEVGVPQFGNENDRRFWLGRSQVFDGSYNGRIAEVITYSNRKNDATERRRIETYLAIKYGITLGVNGISQNYQDSNGNIIWNTSTGGGGFNFDIAGIGRDDASQLNQKQSISQNNGINPPVLTIGLGDILPTNAANPNTFNPDRSFLVWGSNGQNMNNAGTPINISFGPDLVTTSTEIPNRKWMVVETGGNVPTVKVSVPTSAVNTIIPPVGNDAFVMIIADDENFTTGIEMVFMTQNGSNQEALFDFDGTKFLTFGVAHETVVPRHLTFDGNDDFVRTDNAPTLSNRFTAMGWVRTLGPNLSNTDQTVFSNTDGSNGFSAHLRSNGRFRMNWSGLGSNTIESSVNIPTSQWHHFAVVFDGSNASLYIDGVLDRVSIASTPTAFSNSFSIGAEFRSQTDVRNYFNGNIEELRIWDRALSASEIRFIMNQEIVQDAAGTRGTVIPVSVTKNDISALGWSNLTAYYSMNSFIGTHINDDSQNHQRGRLIVPDKVQIFNQTAPLPYVSASNGAWSSITVWQNGNQMQLPNSLSIIDNTTPVDWNIVRTQHNINSTGNKTLLGLFVDANELTASNDTKIEVTHYLKLDGMIDLAGRSQLIQTLNSDLDPTSSGIIERDQQGTTDIFKYNYWSSPVGIPNNTTNNNDYNLATVYMDGTNPINPLPINWISGLNGMPTTPISLSSFWIFKFVNAGGNIANWVKITPSDLLQPGLGYIHKGSGAASANQNYVFTGKPNNGLIQHSLAANLLTLFGNPYPSALDLEAFIIDNISATDGAIYMWEHWGGNTHNLSDYQGGYAICNFIGCVPALSHPDVNQSGSGTITPGRFLPVGQAFFLIGDADGGTITFNNNHRAFIKEDNPASNIHFKANKLKKTLTFESNHFNDNAEDVIPSSSTFTRLRFEYTTPSGFKRQLLLGFAESLATKGIDKGIDALNLDEQTDDMYFVQDGHKLNIQGVGAFNKEDHFALTFSAQVLGEGQFKLLDIENAATNFPVYLFDKTENTFTDIRNKEAVIQVDKTGEISDRYEIRFAKSGFKSKAPADANSALQIIHPENAEVLLVDNPQMMKIKEIKVFDLTGRLLYFSQTGSQVRSVYELPVVSKLSGIGIVKLTLEGGETLIKKFTLEKKSVN